VRGEDPSRPAMLSERCRVFERAAGLGSANVDIIVNVVHVWQNYEIVAIRV